MTSPILKIAAGAGIIGLLWYLTPIMDLLYLFAMIVCVPLTLLAAAGIVTDGTYEAITSAPEAIKNFSDQVRSYREELQAA